MRYRVRVLSIINRVFQRETCCGFAQPKNLTPYFLGFDGMYVCPGILQRYPTSCSSTFVHPQGLIRDVDVAQITVECFLYFWDSS